MKKKNIFYRWFICLTLLIHVSIYSIITVSAQSPVLKPAPVRISSFNADYSDGKVIISWKTGSEVNSEGFYLWRSAASSGPYKNITHQMILSSGSPVKGSSYYFEDTEFEEACSKKCYYKLEEIDTRGNKTEYGPVMTVVDNRKD